MTRTSINVKDLLSEYVNDTSPLTRRRTGHITVSFRLHEIIDPSLEFTTPIANVRVALNKPHTFYRANYADEKDKKEYPTHAPWSINNDVNYDEFGAAIDYAQQVESTVRDHSRRNTNVEKETRAFVVRFVQPGNIIREFVFSFHQKLVFCLILIYGPKLVDQPFQIETLGLQPHDRLSNGLQYTRCFPNNLFAFYSMLDAPGGHDVYVSDIAGTAIVTRITTYCSPDLHTWTLLYRLRPWAFLNTIMDTDALHARIHASAAKLNYVKIKTLDESASFCLLVLTVHFHMAQKPDVLVSSWTKYFNVIAHLLFHPTDADLMRGFTKAETEWIHERVHAFRRKQFFALELVQYANLLRMCMHGLTILPCLQLFAVPVPKSDPFVLECDCVSGCSRAARFAMSNNEPVLALYLKQWEQSDLMDVLRFETEYPASYISQFIQSQVPLQQGESFDCRDVVSNKGRRQVWVTCTVRVTMALKLLYLKDEMHVLLCCLLPSTIPHDDHRFYSGTQLVDGGKQWNEEYRLKLLQQFVHSLGVSPALIKPNRVQSIYRMCHHLMSQPDETRASFTQDKARQLFDLFLYDAADLTQPTMYWNEVEQRVDQPAGTAFEPADVHALGMANFPQEGEVNEVLGVGTAQTMELLSVMCKRQKDGTYIPYANTTRWSKLVLTLGHRAKDVVGVMPKLAIEPDGKPVSPDLTPLEDDVVALLSVICIATGVIASPQHTSPKWCRDLMEYYRKRLDYENVVGFGLVFPHAVVFNQEPMLSPEAERKDAFAVVVNNTLVQSMFQQYRLTVKAATDDIQKNVQNLMLDSLVPRLRPATEATKAQVREMVKPATIATNYQLHAHQSPIQAGSSVLEEMYPQMTDVYNKHVIQDQQKVSPKQERKGHSIPRALKFAATPSTCTSTTSPLKRQRQV